MAKTKTNSNSITAILINKLNYKKSGFRFAMLEKWNLPNDTIFTDCTHSTINCIEMGDEEVDIVGISNSEYVIQFFKEDSTMKYTDTDFSVERSN